MFEYIRFGLSALFLISGFIVCVFSIVGLYRLKYVLNRMHAQALIDTLGLMLCAIGLIIAIGFKNADGSFDTTSIKLILIVAFLWLTSPVSSHILSKLVYLTDSNVEKETVEIDVDEQGGIKDHE